MDNRKIIEETIEKKFNQLLKQIPAFIKTEKEDEKDFLKFSIIDIYNNTLQTVVDIINEFMRILDNTNRDNYLMSFLNIFFKEKRMFYIGIILIILSFVIYFIDGATI
jgi:translation initiation factor 2 beta subunit (eIF-2beta)/eIF-5